MAARARSTQRGQKASHSVREEDDSSPAAAAAESDGNARDRDGANPDQIEDVLTMFGELSHNPVATESATEEEPQHEEVEQPDESDNSELAPIASLAPAKSEAKEPVERLDDPVRLYLRGIGSVKLLSREGEIAIAKRIEAGREAMIAGLCECPLTFQAIIIWRQELEDGK